MDVLSKIEFVQRQELVRGKEYILTNVDEAERKKKSEQNEPWIILQNVLFLSKDSWSQAQVASFNASLLFSYNVSFSQKEPNF